MSKLNKRLDTTVRKTDHVAKQIVIAGIIVGVLLGGGVFVASVTFAEPVIDEYLVSSKDILSLYNFYDNHNSTSQNEIYFIGSSIVGHGIYPPYINELLNDSDLNITVYNLKIDSDTPLQRSLHIDNIIQLHPKCVIYGISYRSVNPDRFENTVWNPENAALIGNRVSLDSDTISLLSEDEINDLNRTLDIGYMKTFLWSALSFKLFDKKKGYLNYEQDPYDRIIGKTTSEPQDIDKINEKVNNPNYAWRPTVTNESDRHKAALIHNVKKLESAGIPVIIVNMPLHPLVSEKITNESRQNFFDLLNQTGVKWYDYEHAMESKYFRDTHHLNFNGTLEFAPIITDMINKEVESGVIHYS